MSDSPRKLNENSFGYSKSSTNYIMYINLGSEMLYILNNRIKSLEIEDSKRITILTQIATNLYQNEEHDRILKETKSLISSDALNSLLYKICHKSVITLDSSSFSKMVEMILMALKKDVELVKNDFGIVQVTMNHLTCVDSILKNGSVTAPVKAVLAGTFASMRNYDFFLLKKDILNFLLFRHSKISIYLRDNIQANDGHFYIRPPKVAGFFTERTGSIKLSDGVPIGDCVRGLKPFTTTEQFPCVHIRSVLTDLNLHAPKHCKMEILIQQFTELVKRSGGPNYQTKFRLVASYKDEENDKLGNDLFENLKKNELVIVDKEYLTRISEDLTSKILGAQSVGTKHESISLDLDFVGSGETNPSDRAAPAKPQGSSFQVFSSNIDKGGSKLSQKIDGFFGTELASKSLHPEKSSHEAKPNNPVSGKDLLDMMDDL